jgi:hypothetical protein
MLAFLAGWYYLIDVTIMGRDISAVGLLMRGNILLSLRIVNPISPSLICVGK